MIKYKVKNKQGIVIREGMLSHYEDIVLQANDSLGEIVEVEDMIDKGKTLDQIRKEHTRPIGEEPVIITQNILQNLLDRLTESETNFRKAKIDIENVVTKHNKLAEQIEKRIAKMEAKND